MKEYRLASWPELPAEFCRTGHRRALTEMSLRHLSLLQLAEMSGLRKSELRAMLGFLDRRGALDARDREVPASTGRWFWRSRTPAPQTPR